ncbi:unknown [[Mannheimia] succiniciproducens MBEL55E]|uniref:Uncharacterized protein n=1 Tax=Mannheimia succiniciproducens (strain KCTC 0769BP / MBEL55E) TaxID=221988 RepID=Q65RQ8_MANSM|nr:unknown [[Mannheimia] succiniciproducens MBEL55E]
MFLFIFLIGIKVGLLFLLRKRLRILFGFKFMWRFE